MSNPGIRWKKGDSEPGPRIYGFGEPLEGSGFLHILIISVLILALYAALGY